MKQAKEPLSDWNSIEVQNAAESGGIEGLVDSVTPWGATGWAFLPTDPHQRLQIEAMLEGRVIGRAYADRSRADLAKRGKGTGHCSFSLIFDEPIESGATPTFHAVGPNGRSLLPGSKWASVAGHVDRLTHSNAMGWAWMPAEPDRALTVEAVLDGVVIGQAIADEMRADIWASGRGSGRYGFNIRFEVPVGDDRLPDIRVLGPGEATILKSPESLAAFEGVLEGLTRWGATGWAWMPESPYESVHVEAVIDGNVIGRTVADEMRPDLLRRAQGTGRYGFTLAFRIDLTGEKLPTIRALGPHGGTILPGETWSSVSGFVDSISRHGAVGWAWMPGQPQESMRVEAVLDNRVLGSAIADQMREDLAASGRGTGRYGFNLTFDEPLTHERLPEFRVRVDGIVSVLPSVSIIEDPSGVVPSLPSTVAKLVDTQPAAHEASLRAALNSELLDRETVAHLRKLSSLWEVQSTRSSEIAYDIGRSFQRSGSFEEAASWYQAAIVLEPVFPWAYFEMAELVERAGRIEESATHTLKFLALVHANPHAVALDERHKTTLLHRCHKLFGSDVALARETYKSAYRIGVSDYLSILRIIEGALDVGEVAEAQRLMQDLQTRFKLDSYGLLALSRLMEAMHQSDSAVGALVKAGELLPDNVWLRAQICSRLIELGRYAEADAAIHLFSTDPLLEVETVSQRLPALQFRLAVRQKKADTALALLQDYDFRWGDIEPWSYAEAVYTFARFAAVWTPLEIKLLALLKNHLSTMFRTSESACLAVIHYHTAQSEWKTADELVESVADLPVYHSRDMVMRRFEIACQLQKLDVAQLIYSTLWQGKPALNLSESVLAMRFFAELKDWTGAANIAADVLRRGMSLPDDFYGVLQIIRRADQHSRFINLLSEAKREDAYASQLTQILVDDLCVAHGVGHISPLPAGNPIFLSRRNSVLVKPPSPVNPKSAQLAALVCTDRAYFFSVLTLFASMAPTIGKTADWYVFLSEDVPTHWYKLMKDFCQQLGMGIAIVPESEFFVRNDGCPTDYGLFSGGRNLARSAYFRIYAANWLLRSRRYARAVYMDSDIICQGDLRPLFEVDLEKASLAGRPEDISAAVVRAAGKCGVGAENYINSGVLVFNFEHSKIADQLHDAIWQSENAGPRLTFHDQCALNIAFSGWIKHLPEQFNTFLRPFKVHDKELTDGVLLHYLDRPKPWDSTFAGTHRQPWVLAATVVKAILPVQFYHEVTSASMGRAPVVPAVISEAYR
jgi:lipopolysaccharide biosynthesis glycosyltransferase/tetratricopeptide (TPR) repeat protein